MLLAGWSRLSLACPGALNMKEMYACPYCGVPTTGRIIGKKGKKMLYTMCKSCEDYIGSPAAQQEGATMQNRIEMEKKFKKKGNERTIFQAAGPC